MGIIFSILRKIFYIGFTLFLIALLFTTYNILSQFPIKHSIPPTDPVWTSPAYVAQFPNAKERFPFTETFVYESTLKWEGVRAELLVKRPKENGEEVRWDGGEFVGEDGVGLGERLFGLLWNERSFDGKKMARVLPSPAISSTGGRPGIKATVIAHEPNTLMAFSIAMLRNPTGEARGFEVINIEMLPQGVKISVRYIWHQEVKPGWWRGQWSAIYFQLLRRVLWVAKAFRAVGRLPVPIEEVDFAVNINGSRRGEL